MWNERYGAEEFAYGTKPNVFLVETLAKYAPTGSILCAAEGEGRNAVYAATKELNVSAFDISEEGKKKAEKLALKNDVSIDYQVGDFLKMDFKSNSFDAAALIYAHFPPHLLAPYHQRMGSLVKAGGLVILEAFSTNHLKLRTENPKVGGPNKLEMLFSIDKIKEDFPQFEILQLEEVEVELNEGLYHIGTGSVIRFVGRKKD